MSEIDYKEKYKELMKKYEAAEFWSNFVYPDGADPKEIQDELIDYKMVMDIATEVYMHITEGAISKPNTLAQEIIWKSDEILNEHIDRVCIENR